MGEFVEMISIEDLEATINSAREALVCLYIALDRQVADDVNDKVKKALNNQQSVIRYMKDEISLKNKQICQQGLIIKAVQRAVSGLSQPDH